MTFGRRFTPRTFGVRLVLLAVVVATGALPLDVKAPVAQTVDLRLQDLWLVPPAKSGTSPLADAVADFEGGQPERALPVFMAYVNDLVLGGYARLYQGRAELALLRPADASQSAARLLATGPQGYLEEAARRLAADAAEAVGDWTAAARALQALAAGRSIAAAEVHLRLGRAAARAGEADLAASSFRKVYYEFAATAEAEEAAAEMAKLRPLRALPAAEQVTRDLARAHELFTARRHADARKAYDALRRLAKGDDRTLVDLRLAQCDYHLKRYAAARDGLRAFMGHSKSRRAEAQFFYFSALRGLGQHTQYVALARAFVDENPDMRLVEDTLNDLGTFYILADDDAKAATMFAELYRRFPAGTYGDRAAWKSGWWAYRAGEYAEATRVFETAAITFRRADYRPAWLYWAARARGARGDREGAAAGFQKVIADYRNSYYGRQAARALDGILAAPRPAGAGPVSPARYDGPALFATGTPPPNADLIRGLLAAGLYGDAVLEIRRLQIELGSSPYLEATLAYALNRKGQLRPAITAMRRAYPRFMAEGGEMLPREILTVIFPLEFWDLIHKYATAGGLDPYLMTALVAQESTFDPAIRSSANAWGLMQIIPATGRRYATTLGIRPFTTGRLTDPETNVQIGMAYFADLIREFGDIPAALAAYNAGEHRVSAWLAERPGVEPDEFIDDIPFPETQNYVKRVIGTAEDYRLLYRDLKPSR